MNWKLLLSYYMKKLKKKKKKIENYTKEKRLINLEYINWSKVAYFLKLFSTISEVRGERWEVRHDGRGQQVDQLLGRVSGSGVLNCKVLCIQNKSGLLHCKSSAWYSRIAEVAVTDNIKVAWTLKFFLANWKHRKIIKLILI